MASFNSAEAGGVGFFSLSMPTVRRWLGNLGWPILLKELRGDFRKNRFFVTHFLCILAISLGVVGQIFVKSSTEAMTSVQLGRSLFDTFFVIQFLVVLVVFPALTAAAFTEERANKSLGLLITTDLRPGEVVFGKFLATSAYCLITVFATVPLLAISTLFGGVKLEEVFIAYAILIGHTIVIAMLGVFLSSCFTANLRSTLSLYTIVFAYGMLVYFRYEEVWEMWSGSEVQDQTIVGLLLQDPSSRAIVSVEHRVQLLLGLLLVIGFVFAYLFAVTANRVRTSTDDKSSALRVITTLLLALSLLGIVVTPKPDVDATREGIETMSSMFRTDIWSTLALLFVAALVFTTEPLDLSRRIQRRFSRFRGPFAFFRIYTPGAFWGLLFVGLLVAVSIAVLLYRVDGAASWISVESFGDEELKKDWATIVTASRDMVVAFPLYALAFGALGFYLASTGFSRGYGFLTVFFIFIITLLLPLIFELRQWPDSVFSCYYLSPITLHDSLTPDEFHPPDEDGPTFVLFGWPIIDFAKVFYPVAIVTLTSLGLVFAGRRGYPLLRFRKN